MSLLQAILMGLIQGLTEFLPVSSSGHLALFKILFDVNTDTGLMFDVMLHVGTLVAICIVYYKDIVRLIIEFIGILIDGCYNLVVLIRKQYGKEGAYRHVICNACDCFYDTDRYYRLCGGGSGDGGFRGTDRTGNLSDYHGCIIVYLRPDTGGT